MSLGGFDRVSIIISFIQATIAFVPSWPISIIVGLDLSQVAIVQLSQYPSGYNIINSCNIVVSLALILHCLPTAVF